MINPHGNTLVDRTIDAARSEQLRGSFDEYPTVTLDRDLLYDFQNLAQGVYSPLEGFMGRNDFRKVLSDMSLESGVVWPVPIVLDVEAGRTEEINPGERVGLCGPNGEPVGVLDVDSVYRYDEAETCTQLFGTTDDDHPGVRAIRAKAPVLVGGSIKAFADAVDRENRYDLSPRETRVLFRRHGWETVVGFQTRNVPHRAHEYLQKSALEHVDGLLVQPKIGEKKPGDYSDAAILAGYETLLERYYPDELVALATFNSRMLYAGPREAVFDALVRKNYGCTHFVVGRDHAGVGDYYGDFAAQELLEEPDQIGIEVLAYHYAFYCQVCDGIVSEKVCPHDQRHHVEPSGTALRETIDAGERPPPELMRPEVAETVLSLERALIE